jgi:hypothetical protein
LSAYESGAFSAAKQDGLAALIQASCEGRTQSLLVTACLWAFFCLSAFESGAFSAAKQDGLAALIQESCEGRTQSLPVTACLWAFFCLSAFESGAFSAAKQKKSLPASRERLCAQDWIRTSTSFRIPPPQGGLSTNFNTWAPFTRSANIADSVKM